MLDQLNRFGRALTVLVAFSVVVSFGCKPYAPQNIHPIIDCINADRSNIDALITSFWPKDGGTPHWNEIESQALAAGLNIGGCAVHEFVQKYLTPAPGKAAPAPELGWAANALVGSFDKNAKSNNATFKTSLGNL